ncbi:SPOR domain-containing protein, partial [Roseibacterium sp. SDUM158017]|nr:SPOR domain-containing protein [Roseibacterium sp. SDUM158017]
MIETALSRSALAGVLMALSLAGALQAQQAAPAEAPPMDFAANEYVDSGGCVFVRVGLGNRTQWVPRVGADRQQVCGRAP